MAICTLADPIIIASYYFKKRGPGAAVPCSIRAGNKLMRMRTEPSILNLRHALSACRQPTDPNH